MAEISANLITQRIQAAQQLDASLAAIDQSYYANRLKMAESFGLEAQRAEEDHQVQMRRLSQDHAQRMSKLADSRDALGLEDEMKSYETQRSNAEEDYQIQESRRQQDFAIQLRDLEQAHRQQRQERIDQYNQQLADQQAFAETQRQIVINGMTDLVRSLIGVFQQTALAAGNNQSTSSVTSNSVVQNNNFGNVSNPAVIQQVVYQAIHDVFSGHGTG